MSSSREVLESPVRQGVEEKIPYGFEFAANGTPSAPVVKIKDAAGTDKSATCLSGDPTVSGTKIVTPIVQALTAGERYRLDCKVTISGSTQEAFCWIIAED